MELNLAVTCPRGVVSRVVSLTSSSSSSSLLLMGNMRSRSRPQLSARGEGIPPVSDASFTKETHTRSLTQLPILGNVRQWTEASRADSEVRRRR